MRKSKSPAVTQQSTREGDGSCPPRFASQALVVPPSIASALIAPALIPPATIGSAETPHRIEQDVRRVLLSQPSLHFSSLVVRRIDDGVCLQGVLEADDEAPDVCGIAQRVEGVRQVLNRLLIASRHDLPPKG
ncbi:MAG: BON domain-containing protein [Planctomycetaceae bacterium]|nr:BON domain-containing protein [Planctomycetaceae bacterium]